MIGAMVELHKKPEQPDAFSLTCPAGCSRGCVRFYQKHTRLLSFALYATQNPALEPRMICAYAFSCGVEIEGMKFILEPGETPASLVQRVVPELVKVLVEIAEYEKEGRTKEDIQ